VFFTVDENVETTTRTAYNLIDALSNTGGIASIVTFIFTVLTLKI